MTLDFFHLVNDGLVYAAFAGAIPQVDGGPFTSVDRRLVPALEEAVQHLPWYKISNGNFVHYCGDGDLPWRGVHCAHVRQETFPTQCT